MDFWPSKINVYKVLWAGLIGLDLLEIMTILYHNYQCHVRSGGHVDDATSDPMWMRHTGNDEFFCR